VTTAAVDYKQGSGEGWTGLDDSGSKDVIMQAQMPGGNMEVKGRHGDPDEDADPLEKGGEKAKEA
jgi:hypothetical protein